MKKIAMLAAIALAACSALAAQDSWYVCLGSFKKQSNADNYVKYLASKNLSAVIVDATLKDGRLMHRVVQNKTYGSYADAYSVRSKLQKESYILALGIKDLWVFKGGAVSQDKKEKADSAPIDSSYRHDLWLEPTDPHPAAFRKVPGWGGGALDENQDFRFNPNGDFEIVTNGGFNNIVVTRYEFKR